MRAHHGALVALDAVLENPFRHVDGNPPFFIPGGGHREDPVRRKNAHRQVVPLLGQNRTHDRTDKIRLVRFRVPEHRGVRPALRHIDLHQVLKGLVHCGHVHVHDVLPLFTEQLLDLVFQVGDGLFNRDHVGGLKKSGLHDHVDPAPQSRLAGDLHRVDGVEGQFLLGDDPAHVRRQLVLHLIGRPGGVEHEGAALFDPLEDIVGLHVSRLVAGDVIRRIDEIGGLDGGFAEPKMRYGHAA